MTLDPSKYGLTGGNPELYAAIATDDFIRSVGKDAVHVEGDLTNEYLGMLALYALRYGTRKMKGSDFYNMFQLACDNFDPFNMSENFIRCLKDILTIEDSELVIGSPVCAHEK